MTSTLATLRPAALSTLITSYLAVTVSPSSTAVPPSEKAPGKDAIRPFRVNVPDQELADLRRRITETRWPEKETVADQSFTPEQAVLEIDRSAQLRACLTQLSPDHREIIDLVYYHDKTIEEVAEIVGVPRNTVKTRMFYARRRLADLLAQNDDFGHLAAAAV